MTMEDSHQHSFEEVDHYKRVILDASIDKKFKSRQNGCMVLDRQDNSYMVGGEGCSGAVMPPLFLGIVVNRGGRGYCIELVHLGCVHVLCVVCQLQ